MKRKLSLNEIRICMKSIRRLKARNEYLDYLLEYTNLILSKGLMQQERKKLGEIMAQEEQTKEGKEIIDRKIKMNKLTFEILRIQLNKDLNDLNNEKTGNLKVIEQLNDQIKNGVDIKEKKEEKQDEPLGVG